jgi:cysteine desulfurase
MTELDLDANATLGMLPVAWEALRSAPEGNAASVHGRGRAARQAVEAARERCAALLGAFAEEVFFTSGATEANNWAIEGALSGAEPGAGIILSALEHPCVVEPVRQWEQRGMQVHWWPVDGRGMVQVQAVPTTVRLVCLMLANHETGAVQPVAELAATLPAGVHLHCDAAQAVGKIPVHFHRLGVTTLSASGHKFGGPKGIGLLLVRRGYPLPPLLRGGPQQQGRRAGTEPVPLVLGMTAALEWMCQRLQEHRQHLSRLRQHLWQRLSTAAAPVFLNGPAIDEEDVVPNTLNVSFPGCRGDLLVLALDLAGVRCSTGAACSSGSLLPSPTLEAMQVGPERLRSAVRFSFSPLQTLEQIDEAAERIITVVRRLRAKS